MAESRYKTIAVLGIIIIITGILRSFFIGTISASNKVLSETAVSAVIIYSVINNIGWIISGSGVLFLKNWARRLLVFLIIVQIGYIAFFSMPVSHRNAAAITSGTDFDIRMDAQFSLLSPTKQQAIGTPEALGQSTKAMMHRAINMGSLIAIACLIALGIFFTRQGTRKQFKS